MNQIESTPTKHQNKEEEHHHCAGINNYLNDSKEQSILCNVEDRQEQSLRNAIKIAE